MNNYLIKYKELTGKIYEEIKSENLEEASKLITERQSLLDEMNKVEFYGNVDIEKEFSLVSLDKEIQDEINKQKVKVKYQMDELKRQKTASSIYGKQFEDIYFVNRQI